MIEMKGKNIKKQASSKVQDAFEHEAETSSSAQSKKHHKKPKKQYL